MEALMPDSEYCVHCDAPLAVGADTCPACGKPAGPIDGAP